MKYLRICTTKYLGPTNTRGARVKARHEATGKTATLAWDYALEARENHARVAAVLLGREPEFCASLNGQPSGFVFGVDPANDPAVLRDSRPDEVEALATRVVYSNVADPSRPPHYRSDGALSHTTPKADTDFLASHFTHVKVG